jgi:hypothetical protein
LTSGLNDNVAAIAALVLVLCLLRGLVKTLFKPSKKAISYVLNATLLTPAERSFLGCLVFLLPAEIRALTKVRLADIFSVENSYDRAAWISAFNRIQSKHVDFLLCRSDDDRIEIDNNLVENAIRPTALGKKNWLFIGEAEAGERSAISTPSWNRAAVADSILMLICATY